MRISQMVASDSKAGIYRKHSHGASAELRLLELGDNGSLEDHLTI